MNEGKLRKMGDSKKTGGTAFMMHFVDYRHERWTPELTAKVEKYDTPDVSECEIKIEHNAAVKIVSIYVTVKYPDTQENRNQLTELIDLNEELFMAYYKNEIGYI